MKRLETVLASRRVVTPEGVRPATVVVHGGVVASIGEYAPAEAANALDFGDSVVMPGLVDTHVHVNEPGRTDWEGFETATRAAAAGGVTTIFDMPLNSIPPTTSVAALEAKVAAARGRVFVDVGFWGGAVPGNRGELAGIAARGVRGFKCFLVPSGVPEFGHLGGPDLPETAREVARLGAVLLVHAEDPRWVGGAPSDGSRRYSDYLATRPPRAEDEAVLRLAEVARESGARIHVVHLSSASGVAGLDRAREVGATLSAETCPHYLFFSAEEVPDGATEFKCAPPIRERANRERLWAALERGVVEMVVSDHSPSPPEGKKRDAGDFLGAWGGISSLQLRLPAVWTAARERGHGFDRLADWLCAAPARLAGLGGRKGAIAPGFDADFVVWDPEDSFEVRGADLEHRHPLTPYEGRRLSGVVVATFLGGERIFDRGRVASTPRGTLLLADGGRTA